jgi:hypothetical protein
VRQQDAKVLKNVLKQVKELERALAELYRTCGEAWPADREFWLGMEMRKEKHALNIERMLGFIEERPEGFELGRPIQPAVIQTIIAGIRQSIDKVKRGEIGEEQMLYIGRDIEQSMVERRYNEMVKGRQMRYQLLLKEILVDNLAHQEYLDQKILERAL